MDFLFGYGIHDAVVCASYMSLAYLYWISVQSIRVALDAELSKIPGPFLSAYTNLPLKIAILSGRRTLYIHELHEKYGPYVRIGPREVATSDIEAHRIIHRVGSDYNKGSWYQGQVPSQHSDTTSGVFCILNNKTASRRRRLFQSAGTKKIVLEWEPQVIELTTLAVQNIKRDLKKHGSSDVMKQWTLMTTDILGSLAFGQSFGNTKSEGKCQMVRDVEAVMPIIGVRAELPWTKPIFDAIPSWFPLGLNALWNRFTEYGEEAVKATRAAQAGGNKTLFSKMVLDEETVQVIPDSLITQEAANVITAGTDTTAMTLTYLVYTVLKHEEIKQKLVKELAALLPAPKFEQLESLSYLQNVIQEVMRLHPAVPGSLPRIVPAVGGLLGKYTLPAGTQVSTQAWTLQRDETVFPDPLNFDPDRWNDPTAEMKEHMLVFGGSARICLGQNIARLSLAHAVAALFREYPDIMLAPQTTQDSMEMVDYFAIKPKAQKCDIVPAK